MPAIAHRWDNQQVSGRFSRLSVRMGYHAQSPAGVAQQAEQPSCKRQASGSIPLTGSQVRGVFALFMPQCVERFVGRMSMAGSILMMPRVAKGHIEQLPSGSFRVSVYAGIDPPHPAPDSPQVHKVKPEQHARIELGRLLKDASEGRTPESGAPSSTLIDGTRRGELCGLQIRDIDLDRGLVHVAFNYVVRGGQPTSARIPRRTRTGGSPSTRTPAR